MDPRHIEAGAGSQIREIARLFSVVEAERRYFQDLAAALPQALAVFDGGGILSWSNAAFRRLHASDSVRLAEVLPTAALRVAAQKAVETGREGYTEQVSTADATRRFHLQPKASWGGERELLVVIEDLSAMMAASRKDTEDHYGALRAITWDVDTARMELTRVDRAAAEALGLEGELWSPGRSFFARRFPADELARLRALYQSLQLNPPQGGRLVCDYRTSDRHGHTRWFRDYVSVREGWMSGATVDITAETEHRQMAEQDARISTQHAFASTVAHDNNNLLMILRGYGEELSTGLPADSPLRAHVAEILAATERLSVNTRNLAAYTAKQPPLALGPVAIDSYLIASQPKLSAGLPAGADLVLETACAGCRVTSDPLRLANVLAALVASLNGSVRLASSRVADSVRVSVQSISGNAPPPGVFEISARAGAANGPELHLAYQFFRASEAGVVVGVTGYDVILPLAPAPEEVGPKAATLKPFVMVVDDEEAIRGLLRKVLEREGYRVLAAASADAAIEMAQAHEGSLPLLVSDVVMPGMGGVELAQNLSLRRPELRTLLISGFTGETALANAKLPHGFEFLQKPFSLPDLLAKVRALLGESR